MASHLNFSLPRSRFCPVMQCSSPPPPLQFLGEEHCMTRQNSRVGDYLNYTNIKFKIIFERNYQFHFQLLSRFPWRIVEACMWDKRQILFFVNVPFH